MLHFFLLLESSLIEVRERLAAQCFSGDHKVLRQHTRATRHYITLIQLGVELHDQTKLSGIYAHPILAN
jgi:hypothetical protein